MLDPSQLQSLFKDHLQGQLQTLAAHPIANFPLQRLLDAISTPELVSQEPVLSLFLLVLAHWGPILLCAFPSALCP